MPTGWVLMLVALVISSFYFHDDLLAAGAAPAVLDYVQLGGTLVVVIWVAVKAERVFRRLSARRPQHGPLRHVRVSLDIASPFRGQRPIITFENPAVVVTGLRSHGNGWVVHILDRSTGMRHQSFLHRGTPSGSNIGGSYTVFWSD
jgi:hypothetical protein